MQALYDFVGKSYLDPEHQTDKHRKKLRKLWQKDQSPKEYYTRFANLNRLIGCNNFRTDPNKVYNFRRGLHKDLREELAKQLITNADAWDIAKRA